MTPALYIGANILGVRRSAAQVARATAASLRSAGLIMAGLAPAVGFLLISSGQLDGSRFLAALIAEAAFLLGIWTSFEHQKLRTGQGLRSSLMLIGWTLVAVLLNALLLAQWLIA
jgi:riboflavin transporter FmnP